jgi:hypothetical protein
MTAIAISTVTMRRAFRFIAHQDLYDPPQLARRGVGEAPRQRNKLPSRNWTLLLVLKVVELRDELGAAVWLPVHGPKGTARHGDDEFVALHVNVEVVNIVHPPTLTQKSSAEPTAGQGF